MDLGRPTAQPGISLSISLRPVPARLVSQIQSGHYVEMRDLLGDNAAIGRQLEDIRTTMGANILQVSSRPRVRDVTSLESWLCCFLSFLAVGTADLVTRERLAYAILMIRESLQHGGSGWLQYDRLFRQQAAVDHTLPWNVINPGLQATTILAQRSAAGGQFCSLCQDCDHSTEQCALAQLQHQPVETTGRGPTTRLSTSRICHSWNEGACTHPGTCNFRHVCLNCFQASHPAGEERFAHLWLVLVHQWGAGDRDVIFLGQTRGTRHCTITHLFIYFSFGCCLDTCQSVTLVSCFS